MERACPICQAVTFDDSETVCSTCGAELPPVDYEDEPAYEEEAAGPEESESRDGEIAEDEITELELVNGGSTDEERTGGESLEELDLGAVAQEGEPPDEAGPAGTSPEEQPPADEDEWDLGIVGGEAGTDLEDLEESTGEEPVPEPESGEEEGEELVPGPESGGEEGEEPVPETAGEEEIELAENEMLCPECRNVVSVGSEKCGNCGAATEYLVPCDACGMGIDQLAEICPYCYTDLNVYREQHAEPGEEGRTEPETTEAGEPAPEIVGEESGPEEMEPPAEELAEMGENGKLPDKERKRMLKKLRKEQRDLEKQLKRGKITEEEFERRLDEIRMGNGFGPIGGFVLEEDEAEAEEVAKAGSGERLDRRMEREARKEIIREELARERREGLVNYYNMSLVTLFFFVFLAVFVLMEFILTIGNFTTHTDVPRAIFFDFRPTLDQAAGVPVLLFGVILTMGDAVLHIWDRKLNLMLSFIPTGVMILALGIDAANYSVFMHTGLVGIVILLILLVLVLVLDALCLIWYPVVLESQAREELEMFLEKEDEKMDIQQSLEAEYQKMIEEEEEKLKMKDDEINEIKQNLEGLSEQIQQEEEKLRMKEEEISSIKSELELKSQQMMEEEEKLRMKEDEMESLIQTELEKRAQDMFIEEEEKLRMKEEELIKSRNELEIQKNLFDETREKLRMKEQEMMSLRTELENQMRQRMEEEDRLRLKEAAAKMLERGKQKRVLFPFAAMVNQEKMKRALVLNAIYPEVGGVLIRGQKGTGKSVSVRGLAEVLPDIEVTGCKFNCDPAEPDKFCSECKAKHEAGKLETFKRPVQVVDLPLNITEDRLVGSIDIERILSAGEKSFEPGILAEAHRGILYVDEINLLDDYIVDILLDAASSGVVTIEREGLSISHPSRFIIVGSMNPEEGELRPQILDRLALQSDVVGIKNVEDRILIVKRREEFTADPAAFREKFEGQRQELRARIDKARELLPNVTTPDRVYKLIAQICLDFDVDGHRADIIIERAARANAAFEGRLETTLEDVASAAAMALPHRMRRRPSEDEEISEESILRLLKAREAETGE